MTSTAPAPLLIDQCAPHADFTRTAHVLVDADVATTYRAVRDLDPGRVRGPVADTARRMCGPTVHDLAAGTGWVLLGELPGTEVVFGAVVGFRRPRRREVEARDFVDFATPGHVKIACSLSVLPYGQRRTVLTCEVRARATDPRSWLRLRRRGRFAGPFVGLLERAVLRSIGTAAER